MDLGKLTDRSWPALRLLAAGHVAAYRASRGLIGHRMLVGPPMLLLEHVGARSGVRRTTPLAYFTDGDDLVIIASKGGHPSHPAWLHNLRAHPDTEVMVGPEQRLVHAREATEQERPRLWAKAVATYRPFQSYQDRTERQIPVVILEPRAG